jgi:hypothetical protein
VSPPVDSSSGLTNPPALYGGSHGLSGFDSPPESYAYGDRQVVDSERFEMEPHQLDDIVDRVIERIEQRVVDELERRGRRYTPGAF